MQKGGGATCFDETHNHQDIPNQLASTPLLISCIHSLRRESLIAQ